MKRSFDGWRKQLAIVFAAGMLFTSGDLACFSFGANAALSGMDFCFLFDCTDGALGGLFNFCSPINVNEFINSGTGAGGDGIADPVFLGDCPDT